MALKLKNIFATGSDQVAQTYTIESWHVSQSVDAFTGVVAYDITISGSFTLTGSQYVSGSVSASFGPNTVGFHGTSSWSVSSSRSISSSFATSASYAVSSTSASYALSSSYAVSSSYAISASTSDTSTSTNAVTGYYIPSGSSAVQGVLKMFAGAGKTSGTTAVITVSPINLTGKTLGQNLFLGIAPSQSGAIVTATLSSPTSITFNSTPPDVEFTFIATYI